MKKRINDQAQQAKNIRRFYRVVDKAGNFIRKWGLPTVGLAVLALTKNKAKADK